VSVCLRDLGSGVVPLCEGAHWNASHGQQRPRAKPVPAPHCPSKAPPHRRAALAGSLSSKLPLKLGLLLGSGDNLYALEALQRQALEALQRQALHPMQRQREARAPPPVCISPCGATLQKAALSVLHPATRRPPSAPGRQQNDAAAESSGSGPRSAVSMFCLPSIAAAPPYHRPLPCRAAFSVTFCSRPRARSIRRSSLAPSACAFGERGGCLSL